MAKKNPLFIKVSGEPRAARLDTSTLFKQDDTNQLSPIDTYIERSKALFVKLGNLEREGHIKADDDRELYNLFLLGMVSNVESYFRHLFRELILFDAISYGQCLEQQLTYAAAMHHDQKLLPEALLEQCTFISFDNIKSTTKSFLDLTINKGSADHKELVESLFEFEQLCQLRHCIVHRAGLLGSKNAIKLGIDKHKGFFEKPIFLDLNFLQESNVICMNSVKNFNNFIFNSILKRYVDNNKSSIAWNYNIDRKWFKKYFELFDSPLLNDELRNRGAKYYTHKDAYNELKNYHTNA
ncbi:hypothetical protein HJ101_17840 [Vibrio parahaemolyticus]|nr:hypothetical protein [Vibrio parahaemolyticus]MBE4142121.1 hypothetical protein [Vibrio parahaemolyticus]HCG7040486.1 hypothetical protein [Vibrio parahaemolyticus]